MANDIVLYTFWRSSCAHRVRIALAYKDLTYTSVFINLIKGEQRDKTYRPRSSSQRKGVNLISRLSAIELEPQPDEVPKVGKLSLVCLQTVLLETGKDCD